MKLKNKIKFAGISLLTALVFGSLGTLSAVNSVETKAVYSPSKTYTNGDAATYYNGISSTATGTTLLSALQSLNSTKRQSTVGYGSMGTSASSSAFVYTDYDPSSTTTDSKGQTYGTKVLSFYSGSSTTSWNREHVWPNSHGGGSNGSVSSPYVDADIFMPRPTITAENSNRGNSYYVQGMSSSSAGWDPVTAFGESGCYGGTSIRGEAARIIFYCVVADPDLALTENTSSSTPDNKMGKLSDLLKWSLDNPVNSRELNRNEGGEYLQGNRNPFVDHPEYACKIWGDTNSTTKSICANASTTTKTLLKISVTSDDANYNVSVNHYINLKATATYSDDSTEDITSQVTWSSDKTSTATVTGGKVTGVAGTGTYVNITATLGSVSGTHGVYVYDESYGYGTQISSGDSGSGTTSDQWTLVKSDSDLVVGNEYVIANKTSGVTAGALSSTYLNKVDSTFSSDGSTITSLGDGTQVFTLGGSSGAYTFTSSTGVLATNAVKKVNLSNSGTSTWTLSVNSSTYVTAMTSTTSSYGSMKYNGSSPRFTTYSSTSTGMSDVYLYTRSSSSTTPVEPTDTLSLNKSSASISVGETASVTATASGAVTWTSGDSTIASVTSSGTNNVNATITGVKEGSTTITATCGTASATVSVTVTASSTGGDTGDTSTYNIATITKSNSDLGTTSGLSAETAKSYTYQKSATETGSISVLWSAGCFNSSSYDEFAIAKTSGYLKSNDSVVVKSITIDMYRYENITVKSGTTTVTGTTLTATSNSYSINKKFDINSSTWSINNASSYDQYIYTITIEIDSTETTASDYATSFLAAVTCSGSGAVTFAATVWTTMATQFAALSSTQQAVLISASANVSGTTIEQCVARYDAIVTKYGVDTYNDFMGRNPVSASVGVTAVRNEKIMSGVICLIVLASVTTIGCFVLLKKQKED